MEVEIRSTTEAVVSGYVNAVARDSRRLPAEMCRSAKRSFYEMIMPGTFRKAISRTKNVEMRFNHVRTVAGTESETLTLTEDNIGLFAKATIHDPEVIDKAKKNELRGWSFGFVPIDEKWEEADENTDRRKLYELELREVSILDKTPAYYGTSIAAVELRDNETELIEQRSVEDEVKKTELRNADKTDSSKLWKKKFEFLRLKA